jgi:hypothetical protein
MSLALLAAGALGYVSRRRQAAHADDLDGPSADDDDTLGYLPEPGPARRDLNRSSSRS